MHKVDVLANLALLVAMAAGVPSHADIYQWEYINPADPNQGKQQSTTLAPDGAGVDAVPGADLSNRNLTMAYLIGADLSSTLSCSISFCSLIQKSNLSGATFTNADLTSADLYFANLSGANLRGTHLTNAYFFAANLTDADFTGAEIRGANFSARHRLFPALQPFMGTGLTLAQLYSTASYQVGDLSGIGLGDNYLADGNFVGQNFTNVYFGFATLTGANFSSADTRGAQSLDLSSAMTTNLIWTDGHINGLDLDVGGHLTVRDYDGNPSPILITVDQHLSMAPGGTLRLVFETDAWDSTISFAPGIPVTRDGTLELIFADGVNVASQRGRTFDLFDWTGVDPVGEFTVDSPYHWNLSNLYTTGEVTLVAVPEPTTSFLLPFALAAIVARRRGVLSRRSRALPTVASIFSIHKEKEL